MYYDLILNIYEFTGQEWRGTVQTGNQTVEAYGRTTDELVRNMLRRLKDRGVKVYSGLIVKYQDDHK